MRGRARAANSGVYIMGAAAANIAAVKRIAGNSDRLAGAGYSLNSFCARGGFTAKERNNAAGL